MEQVRIGIIGLGRRGPNLLNEFLNVPGVSVRAVCDIIEDRAAAAVARVENAKQPKPQAYFGDDQVYRKLLARDDIDLVINATQPQAHTPIAVDALRAGKHVAVEVPAAVTVEECWQLVETAEQTQRHCMMLENCCYGEIEMMVLNMVRAGLLGTLTHGEGAYIHDLRAEKFTVSPWRLALARELNGNLYPTHGLGPIAQYMSINRGDRFARLVSMSSPAAGMQEYAEQNFGKNDPRAQGSFACGDMNLSLIQTAKGRSIMLQYDTTTPRPYSRLNLISGTKGTFAGYPDRIAFKHADWEDIAPYQEKYRHPLWTKVGEQAKAGGHGGMDYVMAWRLIDCLRRGLPLDQDVYDAAAWSAPMALSIQSVAQKSMPVEFPDFTRGAWTNRAEFVVNL
jgi:predicted dehydrogenase